MQNQIVYITVVLIWSTTPLAIKWSTEAGFILGVGSRMTIAMLLALCLSILFRIRLPFDAPARHTYLAGGLGVYASLTLTYWGAQYIPSGWISVIFGISPILASIMAAIWLNERRLTVNKLLSLLISLCGLAVMVNQDLHLQAETIWGAAAILASTMFHTSSMIIIKKINAPIQAFASMTGSLILVTILYLFTWIAMGGEFPAVISGRAISSILYLSIFGSVLGFMLFFYLLKHISVTRLSLVALITPACSLMLGSWLNHEPLTIQTWTGTALVLTGLLLFEYGSSISSSLKLFGTAAEK